MTNKDMIEKISGVIKENEKVFMTSEEYLAIINDQGESATAAETELPAEEISASVSSTVETQQSGGQESAQTESLPETDPHISPENFQDFNFSRQAHLEYFRRNGYDTELLGNEISTEQCNIRDYQRLLIYSFIINNIPEGSKILEISSIDSGLAEKLKGKYRFWHVRNPQLLQRDSFQDGIRISIKGPDGISRDVSELSDFFEFVFTIDGIDSNTYEDLRMNNIVFNINRMMRRGAYSLHCFDIVMTKKYYVYNLLFMKLFLLWQTRSKSLLPFEEPTVAKDVFGLTFIPEEVPYQERNFLMNEDNPMLLSANVIRRKHLPLISRSTNTKRADYFKKYPIYVFHHLIKCGGTSITDALDSWFAIETDLSHYRDLDRNYTLKFRHSIDNLIGDTCIRGHFWEDGLFVSQRYPELLYSGSPMKVFTFIRSPLMTSISLFHYLSNLGYIKDYDLKSYLYDQKNFLASMFPCTEENYREVLDRYFFIGIVERMQESMDMLADLVGKKRVRVPELNKSKKDTQFAGLDPKVIKDFREINRLDYLIYNYCYDKFERMLKSR